MCLHFGTNRSRIFASLSNNAFGMYLFHYIFVVWLQYAVLGMAWFAIAKAVAVFCGTVLLSWTTSTAMRFVPFGWLLIGTERQIFANVPSSHGNSYPDAQYNSDRQVLRPQNVVR
jgi:hypothetical protein